MDNENVRVLPFITGNLSGHISKSHRLRSVRFASAKMAKFSMKTVIFLIQKRLSSTLSASPSPSSSPSSFTVEYLVNSCGLPLESAIATSQKLHLLEKNRERPDSVLSLFRSHGFGNTHIAEIIRKNPTVLTSYKVDENLKPKIEYFVENGFVGPDLHELILRSPTILGSSLTCRIKPSLNFLRAFLGTTDDRVKRALRRGRRLLTTDLEGCLQPNIDLLTKEGVAADAIAKFFVRYPILFLSSVDRVARAVKTVKELGMDPAAAPLFLHAVTVMSGIDDSLCKKKMEVYKSFGWSEEDIWSCFSRYPQCLAHGEEKLRTSLDFYANTMKLKKDDIVKCPVLLSFSFDKRVRPRYDVLKVLLLKKLLKEDANLAYPIRITEEKFLEKYVTKNLQQVPSLLEMYQSDRMAKKIGI